MVYIWRMVYYNENVVLLTKQGIYLLAISTDVWDNNYWSILFMVSVVRLCGSLQVQYNPWIRLTEVFVLAFNYLPIYIFSSDHKIIIMLHSHCRVAYIKTRHT